MEADYLMEQKVKLLVELQTKEFTRIAQELQSKIVALEHEVDTLKTNVKGVAQQAAEKPPFQPQQALDAIQQALQGQGQSPTPQAAAQEESVSLPSSGPQPAQPQAAQTVVQAKTGDVTPEDVSVEKMFYFGK